MTERQKEHEAAMNEQPTGKRLSTADMAAAAERQEREEIGEMQRMQADAVPVESRPNPEPAPTRPAPNAATSTPAPNSAASTPLLVDDELTTFRSRWTSIQTGFVDEPRRAVEQADTLVAEVMKRLAEIFADERARLEGQWSRGDNVSTEDLRIALQRYRSFFDRLLSM
jgi:hypothetical protein